MKRRINDIIVTSIIGAISITIISILIIVTLDCIDFFHEEGVQEDFEFSGIMNTALEHYPIESIEGIRQYYFDPKNAPSMVEIASVFMPAVTDKGYEVNDEHTMLDMVTDGKYELDRGLFHYNIKRVKRR